MKEEPKKLPEVYSRINKFKKVMGINQVYQQFFFSCQTQI